MIILVMFKYPHQLMPVLRSFGYVIMLFFHVCQQEELFRMKIMYAFMVDGPKRAGTKFASIG